MADVPEQKNFITRYVAVLKSLANKAKKGLKKNSYNQKKNGKDNDIMNFMKDLLIVLAGVSSIKKVVINTLVTEMSVIEDFIKTNLKDSLKEYISCGVDTPIPDYLKYTGSGCDIKLNNIDFIGLYHIDPTTDNGKILYDDPFGGANSTDFNTLMYDRTVNPNIEHGWGASITGTDILTLRFDPLSSNGNNSINIRASQYYSNNKNMTDLNNDYIDSLTLFPTEKMITNVIESMFSPISYDLHFPKNWFKKQEEINLIIEKLSEVEETKDINDSFFKFTNEEMYKIDVIATNRSNGVRKLENCNKLTTEISVNTMSSINEAMATATTSSSLVDLTDTVTNSLNQLSTEMSKNIPEKDKFKFELEFFSLIFDGLFKTISNIMLSPKIAILLQLNNKIIFGQSEPEFDSVSDMIYKTKFIYHKLIVLVTIILTTILVKLAILYIKHLIKENVDADTAEMLKARQDQLTSLSGMGFIPNSDMINQLTQIGI